MTGTVTQLVLVHGAWVGAWCWNATQQALGELGCPSVAVELRGHGARSSEQATDLMGYADDVVAAIDRVEGRVILVGHSFGGMVVSQAAELRPDRVAGIVYVAAFLLANDQSFVTATADVAGSAVLANLCFAEDGSTVSVKASAAHASLAQDLPLRDFDVVAPRFQSEPTGPLESRLRTTSERWGGIERHYIETTLDRAVPLTVQRAMQASFRPVAARSLETGHLPMLSDPSGLAAHLAAIVRSVAPPASE